MENFSYKYKSKTEKVLKKCVQKNDFTGIQTFYLGFFIGLLLFQLGIICILAWYYDIDMDNDVEFKSVFPMFRGFFIICLYWWMHGLNILIWTKADISYKIRSVGNSREKKYDNQSYYESKNTKKNALKKYGR